MADVIERVVWVPLQVGTPEDKAEAIEVVMGQPFHWDGTEIHEVSKIDILGQPNMGNMVAVALTCTHGKHVLILTNSRIDACLQHNGDL